jgi:hypothetical protein
MNKAILSIIAALMIQGCATAYHPASSKNGYSEVRLDTNKFRVTFKGNRYTDLERAIDFVLLRSAELVLINGFSYFDVTATYEYSEDDYQSYPTLFYSKGNAHGDHNLRATVTTGNYSYEITRPRYSAEIICFTEQPGDYSYNAALLRDSLINKYKIANR